MIHPLTHVAPARHADSANIDPPTDAKPVDRPDPVDPDSEVGEEDPGAAVDQPAVEPIYPPGSHGH